MSGHFARTILALGEAIVSERQPDAVTPGVLAKNVSEFLLSVHARMPDFLRPLFYLLVLFFDVSPLLRRGTFFHRLPLEQRLLELDNWRRSRIEFRRRFVEFYGSLGVFGLYSDLYGKDYRYGQPATGRRTQSQ